MPAKIRFHLDEGVPQAVAEGLRRRGIEVTTATESGLLSAPDEEHLQFAVTSGRVLVTRDSDYLRMHAQGLRHAGIVWVPHMRSVGEMVRFLALLWEVLTPDDMVNHVEFC